MKRSPGLLTIAAMLVGLGLSTAWYQLVRSSDASPASGGPTPQGAALAENAELAELRREVARLGLQVRSQHGRPSAAPAPAEVAARASGELPPRDSAEAQEERARKRRDRIAGIEAAFRREAVEPGWSATASAAIQAAMVTERDLGPLARGVECRSSTCRVELADDGSGKSAKALQLFIHHLGGELPGVVADRTEGGGGAATMVLYMSRPDPAQAAAP